MKMAEYAATFKDVSSMTVSITSDLVKGVGYARGGSKPENDPQILAPMILDAQTELYKAVRKGHRDPQGVVKGVSSDFQGILTRWMQAGPMSGGLDQLTAQISQVLSANLGKDISLTSPLASGFVPFDLVSPSRLIYPVYSPFRNKMPRVPGQGASRRAKLITGIQGSQTGGSAGTPGRISISEFPAGQTFGNNWPMQLPASGANAATDLNVPFKFAGLTEPISWLAQFSGQGFEDISALANLILLQKFMLGEEYQIFGGLATNLAAPAAPTVLTAPYAVSAGTAAITGVTTNVYVLVTALNIYGNETAYASGSILSAAPDGTTQAFDIAIVPVTGAAYYNVYLATGAANPGRTGFYLYATAQGGVDRTIQGALPTTTANPPAVDTGTGSPNDYDGLFSILSGHASATYGTLSSGYTNQKVGKKASINVFNVALEQMWKNTKADPSEIQMEGGDIGRLSDDIRANTAQNYRLFIAQSEFSAIMAGAAVSEFVNPVTRRMLSIMVHPWYPQGTATILSYTMPFPWTNVPNVQEIVNVQDYLSIAWPVVDVTFRYSMFLYGALVMYAPIYNAILQGLQVSDTAPFS